MLRINKYIGYHKGTHKHVYNVQINAPDDHNMKYSSTRVYYTTLPMPGIIR